MRSGRGVTMSRPQPPRGPKALLGALVVARDYANYDIDGPFPKHRYERQYMVTIYEQDGTVAWTLRGTIAEAVGRVGVGGTPAPVANVAFEDMTMTSRR